MPAELRSVDFTEPAGLLGDGYWGGASILGAMVGAGWLSLDPDDRSRFLYIALSAWSSVPWIDARVLSQSGALIAFEPAGSRLLRSALVNYGTEALLYGTASDQQRACAGAFIHLVRWIWESDGKPITPERAEGGRRESLVLGAGGFAQTVQTGARSILNDLPLQTQNWILSSGLIRSDARSGPSIKPFALEH